MTSTKPFALALTSILVAASARGQDTIAISGCYKFDRAYFHWVGRHPGQSAITTDSTSVLRLSPRSEIAHQLVYGPVLDVVPYPFVADSLTAQRWLRPSNWTFVNANTVNIVWRNGLYGPVFRMSVHGDTLSGQVRFTTDVAGAEPPPEPALALRVACPQGSRQTPRSAAVGFGDSVRVNRQYVRNGAIIGGSIGFVTGAIGGGLLSNTCVNCSKRRIGGIVGAVGVAGGLADPDKPGEPANRQLHAQNWYRLERKAGLERVPGRGWHSLRRKFATDLKHTPLSDLCALGGWKGPEVLLRCYMQPDEKTMRAALDGRTQRLASGQ